MKILFFLSNLILCIICKDFFLKAGTKTEGYCNQGDFIFSYENSFYLNNKYPKEEYDFKLLMENNIISLCKTKKRNLSNKFEIICKIKKYSECYNFSFNTPKLGNLEPEKKILKNGDIIFFEGFKDEIIKKEKKDKKLSETVEIELNPGVIAKEIENMDAINNKKQFYIRDNLLSEEVSTDFFDNVYNFTIDVKVDDQENVIKSNCSFVIEEEYTEIKKVNIICEYPEELEDEPKTINISDAHPPANIQFKDFSGVAFYTVTLGKLEKGFLNSNNYNFYLKNIHISKTLLKTQYISLLVSINEEEKESICRIDGKKNDFKMICIIQKYSPPESYNIYYTKQNYFYFSLTEKNSFSFETNNQDISTSTLKAGYILKESCINGIYTFLIGGNVLSGKLSQPIKANFSLKLKYFNNNANCQIIGNQYNTINCKLNIVEDNETEYCNNLYNDITIDGLLIDNYILIGENEDVLYLEGFNNLQTYTIAGGNLIKGKCNDNNNTYTFKITESKAYNEDLNNKEIKFSLNLYKPDLIANCHFIPNNISEAFNITCEILENNGCPIIDDKNDLVIENNPNDLILETSVRIKFYNFKEKSTIATISPGLLKLDNLNKLLFEDSYIDYTINKNIEFKLNIKLNNDEKNIVCDFTFHKEKNEIICDLENVENNEINLEILENPKDDYISLAEKTIIFNGFKEKKINTLIAGKIKKGECHEKNYNFYFEESKIPKSLWNISKPFVLKMKEPKINIYCSIQKESCRDNETLYKLCGVECIIEGTSQCRFEDEEDYNLIVDQYEPEFIRIDENPLYFSSFSNQNTIEYTISVNNIIKPIDKKGCEYIFYLSNELNPEDLVEDIKFNFNIFLKEIQHSTNCILTEKTNEDSFNSKYDLSCYISLEEDLCNSDNILDYDLKIDNNIKINTNQKVKFEGFINKETVTIFVQNIRDKKVIEGNKYIFELNYDFINNEKEIDSNESFPLNFNNPELNANCFFIKNKEKDYYIKCESNNESLTNEIDIIISKWPEYIILNSQTVYFKNKENLETFSIKAGKIKKGICSEKNYQFNWISTTIPSKIPDESKYKFKAKITEIGDEEVQPYDTICSINGSCEVEIKNCSSILDIILDDKIEIKFISNNPSFSNNSVFFYGFNGRRTYTVKAGQIRKGNLLANKYTFNIINNIITYNNDNTFDIKLASKKDMNNIVNGSCYILKGNNTITCSSEPCSIDKEDDIIINDSKTENDVMEGENILYYEGFKGISTFTIRNEGMIIKREKNGNNYHFSITNNILNEDKEVILNIELKLTYNRKAKCNGIKFENSNDFTFNCSVENIPDNEDFEIEIIEEPTHDYYYFSGYKNKSTLTIEGGQIFLESLNKLKIINNIFKGNPDDILNKSISTNIAYSNDNCVHIACAFDNETNINCDIDNDNYQKIESITITDNFNPIFLNDNYKTITLNFINFKNLAVYNMELVKLESASCPSSSNAYQFNLENNIINENALTNKTLNLSIKINNENKNISCVIEKNALACEIPDTIYKCSTEKQVYDIFIEKNAFNDYTSLSPNTLYVNIKSDFSIATFTPGYIQKISCKNGVYQFRINNNKIIGSIDLGEQPLKFNIKMDGSDGVCSVAVSEGIIKLISCNVDIGETNEFCKNINEDIKKGNISSNEDYISVNNNILYLREIENLETITIEGGNLLKGTCNKENIFEFQFIDSMSYNDIEKDIEFPIKIKAIKNDVILNANCDVPENSKEKFNITCIIKPFESGVCPIMPPDKDLVIINNPGYIAINSKVINFQNFADKTTIVRVKAGKLSYDSKEYILLFSGCTIDEFLINYTFKTEYEFYGSQEHSTNCTVVNSETIKCTMEKIESNIINIIINKDPKDDYEFLNKKTIIFEGFKDKAIYTFVAGKLNKGKCDNENNYEFSFINSTLPISYIFPKPIILRMEKPNRLAMCIINSTMNDIYNDKSLYNVDCFIEGINTCPVSEDIDISVGEEEPSYLPIDGDENKIIYFYSFANKSSKEISLSVGNLLKIGKEDNSCKYSFNFSEVSFEQELSFDDYISFSFDINFNDQKSKANCKIYNMTSKCYIDLKENECNSEDISTYELEIEDKAHVEMIDCLYNLEIKGLNGLKTATISAGHINKKENTYFTLENNSNKRILEDVNFNLTFAIEGNIKNIIANCNIKENLEKSEIKCEITDDLLIKNSDIIINKTSPEYLLKGNLTIYFDKFIGLRTFTIKAGQIQKYPCKEGQDYQFRILNTKSSPNIPEEKAINISIEINNDINGSKNTSAICFLQKNDIYHMNCEIEGLNCVNDIKLSDDINTRDIFGANTTFFQEFNNRRTITIKAGELVKGKLYTLLNDETEYYFTFKNNQFSEEIDKDISFTLKFKSKGVSETAKCIILNLSPENIITCNTSGKLSEDDDIIIESDPSPNYGLFYPNSLYFINFFNQKTTTIRMEESGMIIKGQINGNKLSFIITHNTINDKNNLDNLTNLEIEVLKEKDVKEKAICNIDQLKDIDDFNISCSISGMGINEEIIIADNPTYQDYYFIGYKGKKTLTIEAGSIEKKELNSFYIVKNKYLVDIEEILLNITMNINYNNNINSTASCQLESISDNDNYKDFKCIITNCVEDIQTITILDDPEAFLLDDKNTTINFINFKYISLYSLNLGKILKDGCNPNSYVLYFANTTISKSIKNAALFNLPIIINDREDKEIRCQINPNAETFNMYCIINNYCPRENIDIKVATNNYNKKIPSLNYNTININIKNNISSTTLKIGYLKKISCTSNIYVFTINSNSMVGQKINMINFQYKLKISQFENEASCSLNKDNYVSTCTLKIKEDDENEKSYCENIYKDIKVENLLGDNYIVIDKNIVNFYGFDKLETFTVVAGDLNRGICYDNIYKFTIKNCKIYNNLTNTETKEFSLKLKDLEELNVQCILPEYLETNKPFDINCSFKGDNNCLIILDNDFQIGDNNPNDIIIDSKRVMFKNFINKSTVTKIKAGLLTLEKVENSDRYYFQFINSDIDYEYTEDFNFNLKYELNGHPATNKCKLEANTTNIVCEINNLENNVKDINIRISQNPNDNYEYFDSKTIVFENFINKEIYTFTAGQIEKGECDLDTLKYTFYFNNSKCSYGYEIESSFYIQMNKPRRIASCNSNKNSNNSVEYNVICTISGVSTCPIEEKEDITVNEKVEPSPFRINDNVIIYYSNFIGQTTDTKKKYYITEGILTKTNVLKNNNEVKFSITDCKINEDLDLKEKCAFNIDVNIDIYDTTRNKKFQDINCTIEKGIYKKNQLFDIECSLSSLDYIEDDNYDIQIINVNEKIELVDENATIYFNLQSYLKTITLHNCELTKGKNDENNNYLYTLSDCKLPEYQKLSFDKIEFILNIKDNLTSKCELFLNNPSIIQCVIDNYDKNYILLADNNPIINYTKYDKNFYISGLNNLSVNTLNAGELIFGECDSDEYIFTFKNSHISSELLSEISFNLTIESIESNYGVSICTIPKNIKDFNLSCIIKGENTCPLTDKYSLIIKEIAEEKIKSDNKNTIYLNNFKNREKIEIIAGNLTIGECEDNKLNFSFIDSNFKGRGLDRLTNFSMNLKNPEIQASCSLDIVNNITNCFIFGNDECPLYISTYLETGEDNPSTDDSVKNTIIFYSNFNNKRVDFTNYYISIMDYQNNSCVDEKYIFNLTAIIKSKNIPENEEFTLNLMNINKAIINAKCIFSKNTAIDSYNNIYCIIDDIIVGNLILIFDKIYIKEKEIYIINLDGKKSFEFENVKCPLFFPDITGEILPKNSSFSNSFYFILSFKTSFTGKIINVMYHNKTYKNNNILEFYLIPDSTTSDGFLLFENILKEEAKYIAECEVPNIAEKSLFLNCSVNEVSDNKSDYFVLEDTRDIIKVENTEIELKGISGLKIKNIFKPNKTAPEPDTGEPDTGEPDTGEPDTGEPDTGEPDTGEPDTGEPDTTDPNDKSNKKKEGGISTAGKVILIIMIILVVILIVLVLLYFFYCKNKEEDISENNTTNNSGNGHSNQAGNRGDEKEENLMGNQNKEKDDNYFEGENKGSIKNDEERYNYR